MLTIVKIYAAKITRNLLSLRPDLRSPPPDEPAVLHHHLEQRGAENAGQKNVGSSRSDLIASKLLIVQNDFWA